MGNSKNKPKIRWILQIYVRGGRSRLHASEPGVTMIRPWLNQRPFDCAQSTLCLQPVKTSCLLVYNVILIDLSSSSSICLVVISWLSFLRCQSIICFFGLYVREPRRQSSHGVSNTSWNSIPSNAEDVSLISRPCRILEHFTARFDGVHAFGYNSAESEQIWMKWSTLSTLSDAAQLKMRFRASRYLLTV